MDWQMLGAIGEIVGGLGVVASLVYLAKEVRDASKEARRESLAELTRDASRFAEELARSPEWASIVLRGFQDRDSLDDLERFRFNSGLLSLFRAFESEFHYSQEGAIHELAREMFQPAMLDLLGLPGVRDYWEDRSHWYSQGFRDEVARLMNTPGFALSAQYAPRPAARMTAG